MDPELQRIVQHALDAGKSDDEIKALVAQHRQTGALAQPGQGGQMGAALARGVAAGEKFDAPPPPDQPGLIARIAKGLAQGVASIPHDLYKTFVVPTPSDLSNEQTRLKMQEMGIDPNTVKPGQSDEDFKNAAIHTIGNAASALVGAPEVGALDKLSMAQRALQSAKLAGKIGAITGAAQADQAPGTDLGTALANRAESAVGGGVTGAVIGGALPFAGALVSRVANSTPVSAVTDAVSAVGRKFGELAPGLSVAEPTEAQQAKLEAQRLVQKIFGDAKPRYVNRFLNKYEGAVQKSGLDPAAESARLNGPFLSPGAPPLATLGDVAGDPGVQLTGTLVRTPNSKAGQALKDEALQRSAGRGARMRAGLEAARGEDTALPQLPGQIKAETQPGYQAAYDRAVAESPPIPLTPEQQKVLAHPNITKAFRAAQQENSGLLSAGQGKPLEPFTLQGRMDAGLPVSEADKQALLKNRVAAMIGGGQAVPTIASDIDANTLHTVIKHLGDQIDLAGGPSKARDLVAQKSILSEALHGSEDGLSPGSPLFKEADALFKASKQRQEAAAAGQKVGTLSGYNDKQIQGMIDGSIPLPGEAEATGFPMSPETEAEFRRGFAGTLGQRLGDRDVNGLLNNDKSVVYDKRLRAGLGDQVTDKFMPVAKAETDLTKMEQQVLRGSQTAERFGQDQAFSDNPTADILSSTLSPMGGMNLPAKGLKAMFAAGRRGVGNWASGVNAGTADAGADFMMANPTDAQRLLAIRKIAQRKQAELLAKAGGVGANLSQQP